jgi:hypothetical protein
VKKFSGEGRIREAGDAKKYLRNNNGTWRLTISVGAEKNIILHPLAFRDQNLK